ncbi:hypothetical protein HY945_02825, partial [Candidatus Gottesmanbacteria bacterium]|nr:hypothetical protein [Candidatus Gottesmanbacteria bacterium]
MKLIFKTAKIAAPSSPARWGTVFSENGLLILLEVTGNEVNPAAVAGKEILDTILTKFTNYQERNASLIRKLLAEFKEKSEIITLIIGLLEGQTLFLGNKGKGAVWLRRGEKVGKILSNEETSYGEMKEKDRLIFASDSFSDIVDREKLRQIINFTEIDEVPEDIAPSLFQNNALAGMAMLIVSVHAQAEEDRPSWDKVSKVTLLKGKIKRFISLTSSGLGETDEEAKSKRTLLSIAVVLILLLTASIFLNINHSKGSKKNERLAETISLVSHQYDEAVSLIDLNPVRARELLSTGKLSLAALLSEFPKNSNQYKEINDWLGKLSAQEVVAYKIYKLTQVPIFYDISLIKQEGMGEKIVYYGESKAILDTKNKAVYSLSTKTKKAEIAAGSDTIKDAQAIDIHGKNIYILNSDGVVQIDIPSKTAKTIIKRDEKWGDIASLAAFGGNIYLLDRKNNTIWKYIATDFGFSARTTYLNPDVRVNFAGSTKMVVDGSVWVLQSGNILKFSRGLGEQFSFKGISDAIPNLASFTTSGEEHFLYMLDKTLSRIVVFDKDGNYQSQYSWDELKNATDLVVS